MNEFKVGDKVWYNKLQWIIFELQGNGDAVLLTTTIACPTIMPLSMLIKVDGEEFTNQSGVKYKMLYSETQNNWGIFIETSEDNICIVRFKSLDNAMNLMRLIKSSI